MQMRGSKVSEHTQLTAGHVFIFIGIVAGFHISGTLYGFLLGGISGFICYQCHTYFIESALLRAQRLTEFYYFTIALQAKCAKADGVVTPEEIKAFKDVMTVPSTYHAAVARVFDEERKSTASYEAIAKKLREICSGEKLKDLHTIYESLHYISAANGHIIQNQMTFLKAVGNIFGFEMSQQKKMRMNWGISEDGSIKGGFKSSSSGFVTDEVNGRSVYDILGVDQKASLEQVRKAYRAQLKKKHPDRLRGDGASDLEIKRAEHEVSDLTEAYEMVKSVLKERSQPE